MRWQLSWLKGQLRDRAVTPFVLCTAWLVTAVCGAEPLAAQAPAHPRALTDTAWYLGRYSPDVSHDAGGSIVIRVDEQDGSVLRGMIDAPIKGSFRGRYSDGDTVARLVSANTQGDTTLWLVLRTDHQLDGRYVIKSGNRRGEKGFFLTGLVEGPALDTPWNVPVRVATAPTPSTVTSVPPAPVADDGRRQDFASSVTDSSKLTNGATGALDVAPTASTPAVDQNAALPTRAVSSGSSPASRETETATWGWWTAGMLGIALIAWLLSFGRDLNRIREDKRVWLAMVFVPGLYLCLLVSAGLAAGVAGSLIYGLWWVFSFIGRIPAGLMLMLGLGGLFGVITVIRAAWASIRRTETRALAVRVDEASAPELFRELARLGARMGVTRPANVLLEMGTGFYVTEAQVRSFDGVCKGRTLCLSAPLLRLLTKEQTMAVLAHEYAHFTGADTLYSRRFYPVYRGTSSALREMAQFTSAKGDNAATASIALLLPMLILGKYLAVFTTHERAIARTREFRADAAAARVTSAAAIGGALTTVSAYSRYWSQMEGAIRELLAADKCFTNMSEYFASVCADNPELVATALAATGDSVTHPTDTHPRLADRLSALRYQSSTVTLPPFTDSGAALIQHMSAYEERLSEQLTTRTALIASNQKSVTSEA